MSLPDNVLSTTPVPAPFLVPDDVVRASLLEDFERGGVNLSNPEDGLVVQTWRGFVDGSTVKFESPTWPPSTVLTDAGITELSMSFDQNMRPMVAYMVGSTAKLYWYDSLIEAHTTTTLAAGITSPTLTHDDKRDGRTGASDVLLLYILGGQLRYRQQRDRFTVERVLATVPAGTTRLRRVGMNTQLRVQIEYDVEVPA